MLLGYLVAGDTQEFAYGMQGAVRFPAGMSVNIMEAGCRANPNSPGVVCQSGSVFQVDATHPVAGIQRHRCPPEVYKVCFRFS